ncbi:ComEC/Rec2 family competence protein [Aestuariispira ectoiniformans]|uniref:ComEC/Rec2 family competence protein n=1 Tax=Aestuariispira ectoiniformans TaxID=2775080 RepID=UPI00223B9FE4|nr:ComEC/Rec2 family competence protein [Aestuariispira ectoiniformans]
MDRIFVFSPIALAIGIAVYFQLPFEPPAIVTFPIALTVGLGLLLFVFTIQRDAMRISGILLLCAVVGFAAAQGRTMVVAAPVLPHHWEGKHSFYGRIIQIEHFDDGDRLTLDQVTLKKIGHEDTPERIRLKTRSSGKLNIGDFIQGLAVLRSPPQPSVPGVYDFTRRAWFMRIGAVGFTLGEPVRRLTPLQSAVTDSLWILVNRLRDNVGEALFKAMDDDRTAGLAVALSIGDRSRIAPEVREELRAAGLAHLLAISGLHMMLVVICLFSTSRALLASIEPLALRYPIKKWAALFAIAGALGYLLLAGITIPTQRAFLMAFLAMLAVIIDRTPISLRLVAFAAIVILVLRPEALLSPSFQLSFAAVTALVAFFETPIMQQFNSAIRKTVFRRAAGYFLLLSLTTLVASMATAPFAWHHFGQVAPYGLLGNLVAIPLMAFVVMPLLIVTVFAALILPAGALALLAWPLHKGLELILSVSGWVSGIEGAQIQLTPLHSWSLSIIVSGGLVLCLCHGKKRWLGMIGIVGGISIAPLFPPPDFLISGNGRLVAIRATDDDIYYSTLKREGYVAELWLNHLGGQRAIAFPERETSWPGGMIRCDTLACSAALEGGIVAGIVDKELALLEDCSYADILLAPTTTVPRSRCRRPTILIDRQALKKNGGYAIYLKGRYPWSTSPELVTFRQESGLRPWSGFSDR